ncbi:arabinosyltransferase domain-containing protein [Nocardia camponoti]|uniref:Arabinosyltransferase C n=1 Tax=Nocardia camponoti TaxID=1616106 RepID=A0A917QL28_9NOCA|nr:arabinosyltransferase domain-containing protein [Nocardia camponoti]GGK55602.1 putative arabinosyltransferase C [Nocardia camponoti]
MAGNRADRAFTRYRLVAIVCGLLGVVLALSTPLLPVKQDRASIQWPQPGVTSVEAPLVSYVPQQFTATLPCSMFTAPPVATPDKATTLLSTIPAASGQTSKGMSVVIRDGSVAVQARDVPMLSAPVDEIAGCTAISIDSTIGATTVEFVGANRKDGTPFRNTVTVDKRPQVVGLYTDLDAAALTGANVRVDIDSRFTSTPTALKLAVMIAAGLFTIAALVALHLLDTADGRRARRILPRHWWRVTPTDVVVVGTLLIWHVIGANTSDDGYILSMARASGPSGYMANYYRWFGVPEAPFGWSYEVLAWMTHISDSSVWMRLPALVAGLVCWAVISREVLPRLGARVRRDKVALWTAGLVFLAFWLPYDNGLRPEPLIAAGALLTWCAIERAIATGRLLPAALAVLIAAFSLAAGPTGLICIAALIAGAGPVSRIIIKRASGGVSLRDKVFRFAALLAPGVAAGMIVLVVVFADQTLATVMEATRVRTLVGPNVAWFDERTRWDSLLALSPDGSLARRFGVLVMLLCLLVCILQVLRKNRIPGTSRGPSVRLLGIIFGALLLMMWTPTKWTHHFGVYAGLAGSLAALAAVAVGSTGIRAPRNRALFSAAVLFVLAITFTGSNGWWYVSSYGIPFWDKAPLIAGKGVSTIFLGLSVVALLVALYFHLRAPYAPRKPVRFDRFATMPLTIAAAVLVAFEVLSMAKGAVTQFPAYSIAKSNIKSLYGDTCGLANDVLVETNTADSLLQPFDGDPATALSAESVGFTPNGVAADLTADADETTVGGANSVDRDSANKTTNTTGAGTGGGTTTQPGINGSTVALPFGLDPARTPVLGSYQDGVQQQAKLTSQWYRFSLGDSMRDDPALQALVITVAGRIRYIDADGVDHYGQDLKLEYGHRNADGSVINTGSIAPIDVGPAPSWRNLRIPLDSIPTDANAVRLVATDNDITAKQWLAVTPPRLPRLATLESVVGNTAPVLLDWHVGLAFPCQRPFAHKDGVAEAPEWRILPDRVGSDASNAWQDDIGGGPLGWTGPLLKSETVPTYLDNDLGRDWGALERFTPFAPAPPARIDVTVVTTAGTAKEPAIKAR